MKVFGPAGIEPAPDVELVECPDFIANDEEPVAAVRSSPEAAVVRAAAAAAQQGGALVSAGSTGATMTAALFALKRAQGVHRPALAVQIPVPGREGPPLVLLDCGANTDVRPQHLIPFAFLGSAFARAVLGAESPRVALLSVGEEQKKGRPDVVEAHEGLSEAEGIRFIGNVEGRDLLTGEADVVVTDGFTGNIALKVGEGIADYVLQQVRAVIKSSVLYTGAAILLKPALRRAFKSMRYEEYGGANLLGVNGVVVIGHGRSDGMAVKNAIRVARTAASSGLIDQMRASFQKEPNPASTGVGGGG